MPNQDDSVFIHLKLNQDQYDTLLFTLGFAAGAARRDKNPKFQAMVNDLKEFLRKQVEDQRKPKGWH